MKVKSGDLVHVTFLDHVEDGSVPLECHVLGRLKYKGKLINGRRFLVVESWFFGDDVDDATAESNAKTFVILSSTVTAIEPLSPVDKPEGA